MSCWRLTTLLAVGLLVLVTVAGCGPRVASNPEPSKPDPTRPDPDNPTPPKIIDDGNPMDKTKKEESNQKKKFRRPDIHYVPTPQEVVDKMLEVAEVKKTDLVYDLGCGDGRIVVTAAKKFGCRAVGFDIDPVRVKEATANVKLNQVEKLVQIKHDDVFTLDLSEVDVVTLYLLPSLNVKLIPQLMKLKPGSRIVSHAFDMEGVEPTQVIKNIKTKDGGTHSIYLWAVDKDKKIWANVAPSKGPKPPPG